ncbi:hypothetical protein CAOG_02420 [Capsaspora owczarzaki ATCC 30864]|uniref:PAS domain-containing protein n=1 Tax=Capsaspora owczarzaki (strain ATCC 30864) TaxID=595528 RepID=A0A0D2WL76_CAPO3|nr:hypothetical protein CAOG_02420 [Capsaspora owczarzaki ATCC 30864]KJE91260.1 hypothetical protein CAOG_002420 [Capsaspora owczarzaki ATCC 30864]|eukprot:XP_004349170.1 hypothetical protein CAOG_02420 [Capsaspora owczarzaki ATCC 30864]
MSYLTLDCTGTIVEVSLSTCRMLGYDAPDELCGKHLTHLWPSLVAQDTTESAESLPPSDVPLVGDSQPAAESIPSDLNPSVSTLRPTTTSSPLAPSPPRSVPLLETTVPQSPSDVSDRLTFDSSRTLQQLDLVLRQAQHATDASAMLQEAASLLSSGSSLEPSTLDSASDAHTSSLPEADASLRLLLTHRGDFLRARRKHGDRTFTCVTDVVLGHPAETADDHQPSAAHLPPRVQRAPQLDEAAPEPSDQCDFDWEANECDEHAEPSSDTTAEASEQSKPEYPHAHIRKRSLIDLEAQSQYCHNHHSHNHHHNSNNHTRTRKHQSPAEKKHAHAVHVAQQHHLHVRQHQQQRAAASRRQTHRLVTLFLAPAADMERAMRFSPFVHNNFAVMQLNRWGRVDFVPSCSTSLFLGLNAQQLTGRSLMEFIPNDELSYFCNQMQRIFAERHVSERTIVVTMTTDDGRRVEVELWGVAREGYLICLASEAKATAFESGARFGAATRASEVRHEASAASASAQPPTAPSTTTTENSARQHLMSFIDVLSRQIQQLTVLLGLDHAAKWRLVQVVVGLTHLLEYVCMRAVSTVVTVASLLKGTAFVASQYLLPQYVSKQLAASKWWPL